MTTEVKIFCSYAQQDEQFRQQLEKHLSVLRRSDFIQEWYNRDIDAGSEWAQEIIKHLNTAQIILLLVSPDFINSDYCYSTEMLRALERHETGKAHVIPIILRPVDWYSSPLGELPALPSGGNSVTEWHNRDAAFLNIVLGIRKAIEEIAPSVAALAPAGSSPITVATSKTIEFTIQRGDITTFNADVVALKYAQSFYGADELVADKLIEIGIEPKSLQPLPGDHQYIISRNVIRAPHVLFVGVRDLFDFGYEQIRELSALVLKILANVAPGTRHLAMTIHGVGVGLDEVEALFAQFSGYRDAIQSGQLPPALEYITIIERDPARVQRLRQALDNTLAGANYGIKSPLRWSYHLLTKLSTGMTESKNFGGYAGNIRPIERAGVAFAAKPHAFVAIPFMKEMDDVFYYGIQQPVHAAGFLCERIDQEAFVGDILDRVKKKIETASVVIAELTGANPNVYLEVGYAWGKERPTILLTKNEQELRFDIRGHRCLKYESIRFLEEALSKELRELKEKGMI